MKCPKCGNDVSITDKTCSRCGANIESGEENRILEDMSRYDSRGGEIFENSIADFAAQVSTTKTWVLIFYFVIGLIRAVMSSFVLTGSYYQPTEFSFGMFCSNMLPYISHMLVIFGVFQIAFYTLRALAIIAGRTGNLSFIKLKEYIRSKQDESNK